MVRDPHLKINRISSVEPIYDLSNSIIGMSIKNVEICNSLSVKERTCHAAVESSARMSVSW
jgi:hypothetical protein